MFGLGWQEMLIVLAIVLIIFGAGKLPSVMKSMGQGVKEFKSEAGGALSADAEGVAPASATERPA